MTNNTKIVAMVLVLALAPVGGVLAAGPPSGDPGGEQALSSVPEYSTPEENISVWERSVLPLRADTDAAATEIRNQRVYINSPDGEESPANYDEVGVFDTGEIPLTYNEVSPGATTSEHGGEDVTVIVGQLEPNVSVEDLGVANLTRADAIDNATLENLNDNVDFEQEEEKELNSDGEFEEDYIYDAAESGPYIALVATVDEGDGLTVTEHDGEGNLDPRGNATIIGVESMLVQDSASSVAPPSPAEPGDDIEFEVEETGLDDGNTDHAIVLYDEETFIGERANINVTEEPSTDFSSDGVVIEHTIESFNGVANLEDDVEVFGVSANAQNVTGMNSVDDIVSFIANGVDDRVDDVEHEVIGDTVLNASATAVADRDASDVTVTVETLEDWDEGEYRWIHAATNTSSEQLATSDGTVTIEEETDPSPGPGPGPGPGPDPDIKPTAVIDIDPDPAMVSEKVTFSGADSSVEAGEIVDYEWTIDGQTLEGTEVTTSFDEPGDVDVELTVTTDRFQTDTATATLTITDESIKPEPKPTAAIDIDPDPADVGDEVTFSGADSSVEAGEIVDYEWTIDGETSEGKEVTTSFDELGDVDVELTVTTDDGESDTATATLTVEEDTGLLPIPGFGPGVALVALLAVGLLAARRQH